MTLKTQQLSKPFGILCYRESGQGEPLVLLHGVGMQSATWTPQIDYFSQTKRVIALDMPGHGGSSRLPEDSSLGDFVDWLQAALDALELDKVNLAGHSMGALIAGGFAIHYPERVSRVAVLNGVHNRSAQARVAAMSRAEQISDGDIDIESPLTRWFDDSDADQAIRAKVKGWLLEVDLQGYATAYKAFARDDQMFCARWGEVSCPMLALTADGDPNSTPDMSIAMAAAASNGQAEVIKGHRHMVNLTAPEAVNRRLEAWLKKPC